VKRVGRELVVRYVLEGSVRRSGNRVRITCQLIDVDSGAHLWADRLTQGRRRLLLAQKRRSIELADWSACWGEADLLQ
jgi:TolB-like protein